MICDWCILKKNVEKDKDIISRKWIEFIVTIDNHSNHNPIKININNLKALKLINLDSFNEGDSISFKQMSVEQQNKFKTELMKYSTLHSDAYEQYYRFIGNYIDTYSENNIRSKSIEVLDEQRKSYFKKINETQKLISDIAQHIVNKILFNDGDGGGGGTIIYPSEETLERVKGSIPKKLPIGQGGGNKKHKFYKSINKKKLTNIDRYIIRHISIEYLK